MTEGRVGGRRRRRPLLRGAWVALLAIALVACGSKVTEENYGRISSGMTREEVQKILGAPTDTKTLGIGNLSGTLATWRGRDGSVISLQFLNDRVVGKEYMKPGSQGAG